MLDAKVLENWAVTNDDTILRRALKKTKKISQNPNDITILDYQRDQLFEALGFVTEFDVAIDAGANYGLMTYHLSHKFKEVHSFELFTPVRQCLEQNVRNFNLNNVKVYDCGLGEKEKLEGAEGLVIQGAVETIRKFRPVICYEYADYLDMSELCQTLGLSELPNPKKELEALGYKEFQHLGGDNWLALP